MNNTLKVGLAVGGALVFGLVTGYVLGSSGKRGAEGIAQKAAARAQQADAALKEQEEECTRRTQSARAGKQLMMAKEQLLRATVELLANNYGLTSQHLGIARKHLKQAIKGLGNKRHVRLATDIYDKMAGAQTLAMRLDPMARVQIDEILTQVQRLPGAR